MLFSVTGATGLLGNNLIRRLLDSGHGVRVAIRESSNLGALTGLNLEALKGDLTDPGFAKGLITGCDGLFHAAGYVWIGKTKHKKSMRINVEASCVLAQECALQKKRLIFVSSTDALAEGSLHQPANEENINPAKGNSAYVVSKRAAEAELLNIHRSGALDVVMVNPCLFFGPFDWTPSSGKMILAVNDGYLPFSPRGGISVADVRCVADGLIAAMSQGLPGHRYILAGENIRYKELWRKLAALGGHKGPMCRIPPRMQPFVGFGGDMITKITGREPLINSTALRLGARWNYYDSGKAIQHLDYQPGSLDIAIADSWKWLVDNGYSNKHKTNSS